VTPTTVILVAFVLALVAIPLLFGQVVIALPLALIGIALVAFVDFNRRRRQSQQIEHIRDEAKADKVEFTERDKETLASSD
jgi:Sec-independent protein secretion pathway component TatC